MQFNELRGAKCSPQDVNFIKIPVSAYTFTTEEVKIFNDLFFYARDNITKAITRTQSGGISKAKFDAYGDQWDIRTTSTVVELTAKISGTWYRIQCRQGLIDASEHDETQKIYGRQAFKIFKDLLKKDGINLNDYAIENGSEIKTIIESPMIKFSNEIYADKELKNVYHVDFHNSYPAGLCNTHPEFRDVITKIYQERNEPGKKDKNKAILNYSIGFMQSLSGCGARWAHLTRDAIHDNNERVKKLSATLKAAGYIPILYNTDGIWYQDVENLGPYHGEGEGTELGQWSTDKTATLFRAKSAGAYEYKDADGYHAIVRGKTILDTIKDRKQWQWGDIYTHPETVKYKFTKERGIEIL